MRAYLIRFNCVNARFDKRCARIFGEKNAGVMVEAENEKQAAELFNSTRAPGDKFNPFYLTIKPAA